MVKYKKNGQLFAMKSIRKAHVVKNKKVSDARKSVTTSMPEHAMGRGQGSTDQS